MRKALVMWDVLKELNDFQKSASRKDVRFCLDQDPVWFDKKHLIYLYTLRHKGNFFLRKIRHAYCRFFKKHRFKTACVHCEFEKLEDDNFKSLTSEERRIFDEADRVLRKAENAPIKLINVRVLRDGTYEDDTPRKQVQMQLTQAGEDFTELWGFIKWLWADDWPVMTGMVTAILGLLTALTILGVHALELWTAIYS